MPYLGATATPTLTVSPFSGTTAATLVVTRPDGTTTSPATSTADSGATWTASIVYSQIGWWKFAWTVTGTGAGVAHQAAHVAAAPATELTTPLVATLEEFKKELRFGAGTNEDDLLLSKLTSATQWVEWRIGGPISITQFTERIHTNGWYLKQRRHPLVTVVSVTPQDGTALAASSYIVDTTNSMIQLRFGGYGYYDVVYTAGLAQIRAGIKNAGLEVARHLWNIRNGTAGRGQVPEELIETPFGFAIPNRAEELISADPDNDLMPGFA